MMVGCRDADRRTGSIPNRTREIEALLRMLADRARAAGASQLRVVVESTGVYHRLVLDVANHLGLLTSLVDPSHVRKMRSILFGDAGKTDTRDPYAIEALADTHRLIIDRRLPEAFRLLRIRAKLYSDAECAIIDAKSRIHRALRLLFPDFDFSTDFLYGPSGRAIFRCFSLDPHRIALAPPARLLGRLRKLSRITRNSVDRLLASARASIAVPRAPREVAVLIEQLELAWEDLELHERRRAAARFELERLYDEVRTLEPRYPEPQKGVVSKTNLARLIAETGPLSDYQSWRQLLKMGGLNLRERKSGRYVGLTKISRTGRSMLRVILNQIALPLVKGDRLFGGWYAHKRTVEKMEGKKAMTAVSRKLVKMFWGWYQSGAAFDPSRVFQCASEHRCAA
jgi:transposase